MGFSYWRPESEGFGPTGWARGRALAKEPVESCGSLNAGRRPRKTAIVRAVMPRAASFGDCQDAAETRAFFKGKKNPDLPLLAFLDFLAVFVARNFLVFLSVFHFFPKDFGGSA